jgi:hypothetical protein
VLLAKEEKVLRDMIDKLIETGRCYGMAMNVENKSNENFKTTIPSKIMVDQKQLGNVESFKYLGSILTTDGRCTCEINPLNAELNPICHLLSLLEAHCILNVSRIRVKCRTAMAKAAFNKKRTLFTSKLDLEMMKKLVKCCVWSIDLYGAETWTLRAVDQKHLESFF